MHREAEAQAVNLSLYPATNLSTASKIDQLLASVHLNQKLSTLEKNRRYRLFDLAQKPNEPHLRLTEGIMD